MRSYLFSNYLKGKIELQKTEISLLSLSLFFKSTTGKTKRGIWKGKNYGLTKCGKKGATTATNIGKLISE